jgi:hypothetical protein
MANDTRFCALPRRARGSEVDMCHRGRITQAGKREAVIQLL